MNLSSKVQAIALAVAALAAGSANAALQTGNSTTSGNGSVAFLAIDDAASTSLTIDLGVQMTSLLVGGALRDTGGVTAVWDFKNNTFSINGVTQAGTYAYSAQDASFLSAIAGGSYRWGVVTSDNQNGGVVPGQNLIFTSNALDFDTAATSGITGATVSNGSTNVVNLYASSNGTGTQTAGRFGANTATAGAAFVGTTLASAGVGDFNTQFGTNDFLTAVNTSASLMRATLSGATVTVSQLGGLADSVGAALASGGATFFFDDATQTLTYSVAAAVPEPGTYAMLLAGLASVGFVARRRNRNQA